MNTGEIAYLKAIKFQGYDAVLGFKDGREIIIPKDEQIQEYEIGDEYIVIICYDKKNDEYYASEKIDQHLVDVVLNDELKKGQEVEIVLYEETPLGAKASINGKYRGMLYANETFRRIEFGEKTKAYVKEIREDGKIDLILQLQTYKQVPNTAEKVLNELKMAGGFLHFNDKSSPESIHAKFGISKKVFKQTIGALYKQRKITISEEGIRLN